MTSLAGEDRLFEVSVVEPVEPPVKGPAGKTFRAYDPAQVLLMPPSIANWVPEDHLARFVSELVDEVIDLEPFLAVPRGRIANNAKVKQRIARKLRTKLGRAATRDAKRSSNRSSVRSTPSKAANRSYSEAPHEWRLVAACHNVRKLFNDTTPARPAPA